MKVNQQNQRNKSTIQTLLQAKISLSPFLPLYSHSEVIIMPTWIWFLLLKSCYHCSWTWKWLQSLGSVKVYKETIRFENIEYELKLIHCCIIISTREHIKGASRIARISHLHNTAFQQGTRYSEKTFQNFPDHCNLAKSIFQNLY